ncbi:MAG: hypothetical protein KJ648_07465 [Candidatus Omnitrophica bacterium]|nr:hypothetical protein [Candidatus Omnitrophota bacterium]
MDATLHARIAAVLGWTVKDAQSFSLQVLRELVREKDPKLASEITALVWSGEYLYQPAPACFHYGED